MGDDNRSLSHGGKEGGMGGEGPGEESRRQQPWDHRVLTAFAPIILCRLLLVVTLICNWVDQPLFLLEGVIRMINKPKWGAWATKLCILCWDKPRTPASSLENPFLKQ